MTKLKMAVIHCPRREYGCVSMQPSHAFWKGMTEMQKNVEIPWDLFRDLYLYFEYGNASEIDRNALRSRLQQKMDKLLARYLYGRSRTATTAEEREKALREYLEQKD